MTVIAKLASWLLVGLTAVLLYPPLLAGAYLEMGLLLLAIALIIPVLGKPLAGLPILRLVMLRWILWICLVIAAVVTFTSTHPNSAQRVEQWAALFEVGAIARDQQMHYLETGTFANSWQELQMAVLEDFPENSYYRYELAMQSTEPASVKITAIASADHPIKSYTAAVFAVGTGAEATSVKVVCETLKPSQTPPEMPVAPSSSQDQLVCPAGSQDVTAEITPQTGTSSP